MMSELVNKAKKTVREFVEFLSQTSRFPQNVKKEKEKRKEKKEPVLPSANLPFGKEKKSQSGER